MEQKQRGNMEIIPPQEKDMIGRLQEEVALRRVQAMNGEVLTPKRLIDLTARVRQALRVLIQENELPGEINQTAMGAVNVIVLSLADLTKEIKRLWATEGRGD